MASNVKAGALFRNAGLDAALALVNSGSVRIYDGTQPTDADTALGAQVLLAQCPLGSTAFASASAGSASANTITDDSAADATGTATWGSLVNSSNVRKVDFSVGTSGADMNFNSVAIQINAKVSITSLAVSQAA